MRGGHRRSRNSVTGWTRWLPVVMAPIGVLFFQTWLNTETIKRDYKLSALNARLRDLRETLDGLKVDIARLQNMDRIEMEAPDMGLVPPLPSQIEVIYTENSPPLPDQPFLAPPFSGKPEAATAGVVAVMEDKGEPCLTETATRQTALKNMMARLQQIIAGAFSSCFGRS